MKWPVLPKWIPFGAKSGTYGRLVRLVVLLLLLALSGYIYYLDVSIREAFEGRKFALPARVYGRALEVYPGLKLTSDQFVDELKRLGYHESPEPNEAATYHYIMNGVDFTTRDFVFGEGPQASQHLRIQFADGLVSQLQVRAVAGETAKTNASVSASAPAVASEVGAAAASGASPGPAPTVTVDASSGVNPASSPAAAVAPASSPDLPLLRMEPPLIGGIYPGHNEDRELLQLSQVPKSLIDALIAVEDRKFYTHWGVDPRGIARALYKTVTGQRIEGGSTLTQQLVKNFFLTSERTLTRKGTEVLMALLLEMHYSKDEILETYLNEIFLGQDGNRAIHGFGLASYFYFDRPLDRLDIQEVAMLVGMVKGPGLYDPRKNPQLTLQRRNVVLQEMVSQNVITQQQYVAARQKPLGVVARAPMGTSPYPAFMQFVYRQLQTDYREEDLRSEGLRIFTTLDPFVQHDAEDALKTRLTALEKARRMAPNTLEGAVVVSATQTGELQAMVGGRDARYAGYNRAIDAQRQIGSLAKPVIYLTALEQPDHYTLITPLDDSPLVLKQAGTTDWKPQNYDQKFHGQVQLRTALAHSYNVATARLGIALGVDRILDKLPSFGIDRHPPPFASSLLGAYQLSPVEVAQLYQTFADGGFRTPLRAIRAIVTADGKTLQRYPLNVEPVAPAAPVYVLTAALQGVVREGTAQPLANWLPAELNVAGKTGTTNDLHDSWFAGYTGDRVAVVWVGRDDDKSTGLTGASGAMTVWGEMMKNIQPEPLQPVMPEDVEMANVDPASGIRYGDDCKAGIMLPFIKGSAPTDIAACPGAPIEIPKPDDTSALKIDVKPVAKPQPKPQSKPEAKPDEGQKNWFQRIFN